MLGNIDEYREILDKRLLICYTLARSSFYRLFIYFSSGEAQCQTICQWNALSANMMLRGVTAATNAAGARGILTAIVRAAQAG